MTGFVPVLARKGETVLLETDFCGDADDVAALALLCHAAKLRPESFRLGGVSCNVRSPFMVPAVRTVLSAWGLDSVPVAMTADAPPPGGSGNESRFLRALAARWRGAGAGPGLTAAELWRRVLAETADKSLTVVSIGFFNTLSDVLRSDPALFRRKVRLVVAMAGAFGRKAGYADFNIREWPDEARRFIGGCGVPLVMVGSECGDRVATDLSDLPPRFDSHPLVEAFRCFVGPAMSCASWDPVTVDFALNGENGHYELGPRGRVVVSESCATEFIPDEDGDVRVLSLAATDAALSGRTTALVREAAGLPPLRRDARPPADPWGEDQ